MAESEFYKFVNVSDQNYFLSEIGRKVTANRNRVWTFTEKEIIVCTMLQTIIKNGSLRVLDDTPAEEPEFGDSVIVRYSPTKENFEDLLLPEQPKPNPFPQSSPPRDIIIDEPVTRPSILVDQDKADFKSLYDDDSVKKK